MFESVVVCRREFTPELLEHLNAVARQEPPPTRNMLAREACARLAWYSPDGRPATSSAKVALRKLEKRGLLGLPPRAMKPKGRHRLRRSNQPLPGLVGVPERVDQIQGLRLHLIEGAKDSLQGLWNDLIVDQHPRGDAPLVGAQLRYLIGSDHGWLGALGFGPAAFVLQSRDVWVGWSVGARLGHLGQVVGMSRLLIRQEVRCANLVSKVLGMVLGRLPEDWLGRYGVRPLLVETFVDRDKFTGLSLSVSNWLRVGVSSGRGRLGKAGSRSLKDVWLYPLHRDCRRQLQEEVAPPLTPRSITQSLAREDWCVGEMGGVDLGDRRRTRRAVNILEARWRNPQASFYGSFSDWTPAKGAYGLIEHNGPEISLARLLSGHQEATQQRMASEAVVLLAQDTTGLNYTGLRQTTGLGSLGEAKGRGLWLHSLLALRPDGVPLGVLEAQCWGRQPAVASGPQRGRNAKSIDEKESYRWIQAYQQAATAARRMPQTQLVMMADREGDLYELHQAALESPPNLHTLLRAQHDRNLVSHQKLWAHMASLPCGQRRPVQVPRRSGQPARTAEVEVRWGRVEITAPAVGCKKSWPPVEMWVLWVHEPDPPAGVEPLDWMLLSNRPIADAQAAWQRVQWYCRRWVIEEWHRVLKSGCRVEQREFKTAEHLQRVLTFDLIVAWRVLACVKLARAMPQLPASVLYTPEELEVLRAVKKKRHRFRRGG